MHRYFELSLPAAVGANRRPAVMPVRLARRVSHRCRATERTAALSPSSPSLRLFKLLFAQRSDDFKAVAFPKTSSLNEGIQAFGVRCDRSTSLGDQTEVISP